MKEFCVFSMYVSFRICSQVFAVNTSRPRQNGRHFVDEILNYIFLNEDLRISIMNPPKCVSKGRINKMQALVQTMDWRRSGDKPLSEPMMAFFYWRTYASLNEFTLWSGKYYIWIQKICHLVPYYMYWYNKQIFTSIVTFGVFNMWPYISLYIHAYIYIYVYI